MPNTRFIILSINGQAVEIGDPSQLDLKINYSLEAPESFETKQGSQAIGLQLPATKLNDKIFNTYHNPNVEDLSPGQSFRDIMDASISVNGTDTILRGLAQMVSAGFTDKPEVYNVDIQGGNGEWITNMQNLTLWDCLSTTPHTFDVATVEQSWKRASLGGFDSDEAHDFVYAPVRYRQPFGPDDDKLNIYALRPSLSIYWMLQRAFNQFGFTIKSDFLNSQYFRRMVMPWTFGDFYDINSQVTDGLRFKAVGIRPLDPPAGFGPPTGFSEWIFFSGAAHSAVPSLDIDNTGWIPFEYAHSGGPSPASGYIQSLTNFAAGTGATLYQNFRISNVSPPNGYDNFGLYSFDDTTGTMQYTFAPPSPISNLIGNNLTLAFTLGLICRNICQSSAGPVFANIDIEYQINSGPLVIEAFTELSTTTSGATVGSLLYPTFHSFTIPNINQGDVIKIRVKYNCSTANVAVISSGYSNVNPASTGADPRYYNPTTQRWENATYTASTTQWQSMYSSLEMTGFQIQLGNSVNFQYYDAFRNYNFLDLLRGLVDTFDLEIQTNSLTRQVTIEPFSDTVLPDYDADGNYIGDLNLTGYFDTERVLDWTNKIDLSNATLNHLFSSYEQQIDFNFKQDGSDGGQNIFTARYKGLNPSKVIKGRIDKAGRIDNGLVAAVPAASRYMLPDRFIQGNRQKSNRFFSATMHYKHNIWKNITGLGSPAPQLIAIFPENINDSSASAVTQIFEPKIAFYSGLKDPAAFGGWYWQGDPAAPYVPGGTPDAIGFPLPFMFSVNYNNTPVMAGGGDKDPILSYSDQLVYDSTGTPVVASGLMKRYFLRRLAIMRNGQLLDQYMRLNLNDICNFEHRECIKVDKGLYGLIGIEDYDPINDVACKTIMWKMVRPVAVDVDSCYPSNTSITTTPTILTDPYDLRYAQLLLFQTDIPQVG